MKEQRNQRPKWEIDKQLERLIGADIRAGATAFCPLKHDGESHPRWIAVDELILPDETGARGIPLFIEGQLRVFTRSIAVVEAVLDAPQRLRATAEGGVFFRGGTAVLLRGPTMVQLRFPYFIERLPARSADYWHDLQWPNAQFRLPLHEREPRPDVERPESKGPDLVLPPRSKLHDPE